MLELSWYVHLHFRGSPLSTYKFTHSHSHRTQNGLRQGLAILHKLQTARYRLPGIRLEAVLATQKRQAPLCPWRPRVHAHTVEEARVRQRQQP